ncbi:MAG: DUF5348 domain-containing protein [Alicyclobacillus sp.]|nr:DUF5348 domain-containing protein [Alicyclobacillus sp.]
MKGCLRFNPEIERWEFWSGSGEHVRDLHCGDCVQLMVGQTYEGGRIEMADDWYIIFPNARFKLMRRSTYIARMS